MMWIRYLYVVSDSIKRHFCEYWLYYFIGGVFGAAGVIIGLSRAVSIRITLSVDLIKIDYIRNFLRGKSSPISYFFWHLFSCFGFALLALVCTFSVYSLVISPLIIFYRGYLLGLNIFLLANLIGGGGAFAVWVVFFPLELFLIFFGCSIASKGCARCLCAHRFGRVSARNYAYFFRRLWLYFVAIFVICFFEFIFLNIFDGSFIIIV